MLRLACTPVDMTFFERAPFLYIAEEDIAVNAKVLFDSLQGAEDWPCWAKPIHKVEWTSPQPFGIGTTRTVYMAGGLTGYEEFIAWERGREMAFCFTHCSKPNVEAFAERYEITPVGNDRCRLRWTMAMKPRGISRVIMPLASPLLRIGVKRMLVSLKRLLEARANSGSAKSS